MFFFCGGSREKLNEAHSDLQKKKEVIDDLEPKEGGDKREPTSLSSRQLFYL